MPQYENSIVIQRPIEEVFSYFTAIDVSPMWHNKDLDVRRVEDAPVHVGSKLSITAKVMGQETKSVAEVTVWDPPNAVRVEKPDKNVPLAFDFRFTPEGAGTLVTAVTEVDASGMVKLFLPAIAQALQRQGQQGMQEIKALLERETLDETSEAESP